MPYADPKRRKAFKQAYGLRRLYGVSVEQYDALSTAQGHVCALCKTPALDRHKRLVVDHCHATGKVRALLCQPCNRALGQFRDNATILQRAADYLRFHAE
jgi:hypothetical protein